jgi:putative membrane protein
MNAQAFLSGWSIAATVVYGCVAAAGAAYALGARATALHGPPVALSWWRAAGFYAGLVLLLVVFSPSLGELAHRLFAADMLQQTLLIVLAAPLLLLGEPLLTLWHALPGAPRCAALRWLIAQRWPRRAGRAMGAVLGEHRFVWILFAVVVAAWHLPAPFDQAVRQSGVHALELVTLLAVALLFWGQVIPVRPAHVRLGLVARAAYLTVGAMALDLVASVYMFSVGPLYPYYTHLRRAAGDLTALEDQHIAGAVLDVPSTLLICGAIITLLWLWLRQDESDPTDSTRRPFGGRWSQDVATVPPEEVPVAGSR